MLKYAIIFFVIALIAAVLGFGGIAGAATDIARILFVVFLILFVLSLVWDVVAEAVSRNLDGRFARGWGCALPTGFFAASR